MSEAFRYDVFLGHRSLDEAVDRPQAENLQAKGLRIRLAGPKHSPKGWLAKPKRSREGRFDEWAILPGYSIPAKIDPASLRSSAAIKEGLEHSRVLARPANTSARRRMICMSTQVFGSDRARLAYPAGTSERRRKAGTFRLRRITTPRLVRFRAPLNSAFATGLCRDRQGRRFNLLGLDALPKKSFPAQLPYINWHPVPCMHSTKLGLVVSHARREVATCNARIDL